MLTSLFNTAMGPVGLLCSVSALAIAGFAARRFSRRDTKFASVHPGKREVGGCKFDEEEVRKTRFAPTPPIDISNLPAPDPRMVAAFKTINPADLRTKIEMISGETDLTVGGKKVRVKSRSTHGQGYLTVMQWLEEFYASIGLPTKRLSYKKGGKTFYYLVATKQGSSKRKLIVGAHIDSTAGEQYRDEPVAPGADDDGSGTIGLMEYARILAPLDLTHTVELVHFSGEEQGLWASYAYSDIVAAAKTDLIAMLETDMIGYCAKPGNRVDIHDDADKNGSHKLVVMMVRNVARYALNLNPVDTHNHAVEDRSDHAGFLDHGYMGVLVSEEFTDDGFNPRYHSSDERSKYMNFEYMAEVIKMVLATIVDLAEVK
ncbi:MAG TPA: M28 family peptidase [Drouetiella sp.]